MQNRTAFRAPALGVLLTLACAAATAQLSFAADDPETPSGDGLQVAPLQDQAGSGTYTSVKIISGRTMTFPDSTGQDALVRHRVCFSTEGRAETVELLPGGFHTRNFVREAELYARSLVVQPATVNGNPVASCVVVPVTFTFDETDGKARTGVTREFRRELDKATRLIIDGDLAGAHHHTDYMLRDKVKLLYEYAVLQGRLADTYARMGEPHRAIEMAINATSRRQSPFPKVQPGDPLPSNDIRHYLLSKEWITELLTMRLRLAAANGLLAEALQAYYELASLNGSETDAELARTGKILEQALASGAELAGKIKIGESGSWSHSLIYSNFTLSEVRGPLNGLDLRCGPNLRKLEYVADVEWKVPATWRDCSLSIDGEPGTSLTVIEFPPEG